MRQESKNYAIKVGKDFYSGVKQTLTDGDMVTMAFLISGLRGIITRDSNEMLRGFCAGITAGAVCNGVMNLITGGALTDEEPV